MIYVMEPSLKTLESYKAIENILIILNISISIKFLALSIIGFITYLLSLE